MKARKSSSILAVTGSSGDSPSTCFTITLNANCASQGQSRGHGRPTQRKMEKRKERKNEPCKSNKVTMAKDRFMQR
jgi:hypothetical protein